MWLTLVLVVCLEAGVTYSQDKVQTKCGLVKGNKKGDVYEYINIPYAVPPLNDLRWKHSTLLEKGRKPCWDGVYDGSVRGIVKCPWYGTPNETSNESTEDCLVLSVRKPVNTDRNKLLPVLVWVHGGGLYTGYGDEPGYYPTPEFTADLNVITVTFNYRLFAGGFMSRPEAWDDGESYGNFGIGDALQAVTWVKRNIWSFGGDAKKITLLGESSGATVALALAISPKAYNLFNNAICLSASPVWNATHRDSFKNRKTFAKDLGCTQNSRQERLACMKEANFTYVTKKWDNERGWGYYDFPLAQGELNENLEYNVIEPFLIPFRPEDVASKATNRRVMNIYFSNTAQENGYNFFQSHDAGSQVDTWETAENMLKTKLTKFFQLSKNFVDDKAVAKMTEEIKDQYKFNRTSKKNWPQIFWDTITTDLRATCPTNTLAKKMSKATNYNIYRLYIKQRPQEEVCNISYDSIHGWDTEALFGYGYYRLQSSHKRHQRKFKDNMRDIIERIVRGDDIGNWCPNKEETLVLDNTMLFSVKIKKGYPQQDICKFWSYLDSKYDTRLMDYGWQN